MKKKKHNQRAQTLNTLIKLWDRKLKNHGFNDIENRRTGQLKKSGGDVLWDPFLYEQPLQENKMGYTSGVWKDSQAEYYRLAGQALHEKEFKNVRERIIWQLHSEGLSHSEICEAINTTLNKVRRSVERMAREFCLK